MQSFEQQYQTLLNQSDLINYNKIKQLLQQEQKLRTWLLQTSCDMTIFNDDELQREQRVKIAETIIKEKFKIDNIWKIEIEPEFKLQSKFQKKQQIQIGIEHIGLIYQRKSEGVQYIQKQNEELYQIFKVKNSQFLFREVKQGKFYFMVSQQKIEPEVSQNIFNLAFSQSRYQIKLFSKTINEAIINITVLVINNFENKYKQIISSYFPIEYTTSLSSLIIQGNPLATLLVSKIYIDHQRINCVQKRAVFLAKTMKSPNRMIVFYKGNLLYSNHEYLSNNLKKMIQQRQYPKFETVIQQLQYSLKQHTQILLKYQVIGYHQSSSKKWTMIVDREWIQFTFQVEPSRRLGIINKEQKGYLDLFTSGQQLQNPNSNKKAFKVSIVQPQNQQNQKQILEIKFRPLQASKRIDQFQFNILDYDPETAGILSYNIIITRFPTIDIDKIKLQQFIRKIGYLYQMYGNTFHNIYHMFTVLHGAYIMSKCDIFAKLLDIETTFTYLIGALCHDIAHTGVTNFFQQKIQSRLANRFGDKSILESNSIAHALKLLSNQNTNFLINFPEKTWRSFRKLFVTGILATDNKNHMAVFTDFEAATKEKAPLDTDSINKLIGGLLHTVDFWGNIKNFKASYDWSKRVNQQFSKQYERQVELGIELTPYFKDLNNIKVIAKNEQLFTSAIISPLYRRVNQWTEGYVSLAIERITSNTQKWKQVETGSQQIQFFLI